MVCPPWDHPCNSRGSRQHLVTASSLQGAYKGGTSACILNASMASHYPHRITLHSLLRITLLSEGRVTPLSQGKCPLVPGESHTDALGKVALALWHHTTPFVCVSLSTCSSCKGRDSAWCLRTCGWAIVSLLFPTVSLYPSLTKCAW
jgi:hypothetical protein